MFFVPSLHYTLRSVPHMYLGDKTMETQNVFTKIADGIYRPTSVQVKFGGSGNWETRMENRYNSFGKLIESVKDGKECVSYVYGYNGNNCIATVVNVRYDKLLELTSGFITSLYKKMLCMTVITIFLAR